MADESMVRNLAAQAEAIWPQEKALVERYHLPVDAHVLDAGCGTGEITQRLAQMLARARVLGIDIIDGHLDMARAKCAPLGERVRFENRSIFDLGLPARTSISSCAATCFKRFLTPIRRLPSSRASRNAADGCTSWPRTT